MRRFTTDLAGLGPQFKGFKFQVNASNLFDKTYVRLCQDSGCYYGMRRDVIATLRFDGDAAAQDELQITVSVRRMPRWPGYSQFRPPSRRCR